MTAPVADASVYSDLSGLASLKNDARTQSPDAVRKVAQQFESIFAKMVLSSMRQASFGDSLFGSDQQQFYQGMFDDQLSVELTKGKGLGLADMLVQQLTRAGLVKGDVANGNAASDGAASGASGSAGMKGVLPITGSSGAKSAASVASGPASSGNSGSSMGPASSTGLASATGPASFKDPASFRNSISSDWQAGSPEEFVSKLWPCAQQAGEELGVDPRHLIAQAALETGWGKSLPCDTDGSTSFNFFGVKANGSWQGNSVSVKTLEFEGGTPVPRQAKFRSYDSAAESFRDYVEVLRNNPRYADALNTGSDTKAFAGALQRGGYATDPAYAQKIAAIAQNLAAHTPISETALKSSTGAPMTPTMDLF